MAGLFERLFSGEQKAMTKIEKTADEVMALAGEMESKSDAELKEKTKEFQDRFQAGETLDDLLVEAYAVVREAARRVLNEYPYKVQVMGAIVLNGGDIAEMRTGEGKTLTSVMAVYLNAIPQKGVHVVTVNDYLAGRDAEWMGQIYNFLGMTVGFNHRDLSASQKREAYNCDITYTTNSELGFDYLRDNMVTKKEDRVLRGLYTAIVDEVDSILIDESRTPLIISGGAKKTANLYKQADLFAKQLSGSDYEIDEKTRQVQLTESGVTRAEKSFKLKNLYDIEHTQLVHHIQQALRANFVMIRDVEYVVEDNEIVIVDQFTGRKMKGRAYSDGLHQAIEAKEGVTIKEETSTLATITYQNFFRIYDKLAGMTGTAKTEEEEFLDIYNMRVLVVPTNRPIAREDFPDAIYANPRIKFESLVAEVKELHEKGQPVLVGTVSVETSEMLSEMFRKNRIPHEVLNAKNHAREADIIEKAGQVGSVTLATNMAGRGTDIKLSEESRALGGLAVIGSERHESRRIDNQLRGRAGRQGDPGFSRFYVSLKDTLMIRFGGERLQMIEGTLGNEQLESKTITKMITSAQKRVEGYNYDMRKNLLDYDDVLRKQREVMYEQRDFVLESEDVHELVKKMFEHVTQNAVYANADSDRSDAKVDVENLVGTLKTLGLDDSFEMKEEELQGKSMQEVIDYCTELMFKIYDDKIEDIRDQFASFEKTIVLRTIDRNWIDHIDEMSKLRNGIHLRSYAQNNPLQAYIAEGFEMFESMMSRIEKEVVFFALKLNIERRDS